jgi:hypothetical protein
MLVRLLEILDLLPLVRNHCCLTLLTRKLTSCLLVPQWDVNNDDKDKRPPCISGCLCQCGLSCDYLYFVNKSVANPAPIYLLRTPWTIYYQNQLIDGLQAAGMEIINRKKYSNRTITSCGWFQGVSVVALGVRRGYMHFNGTDLLKTGEPGVYVLVENLLRVHYPYVEIVLIVTLAFFIPLTNVAYRRMWKPYYRKANETQAKRVNEEIDKARGLGPEHNWHGYPRYAKKLLTKVMQRSLEKPAEIEILQRGEPNK